MNPEEYLSNPMGKGSAIVPNAQVKSKLNKEFGGIRFSIICNLYILADHWIIYHVKIPSHSQKGVIYDVVIEFDKSILEERGYDRINQLAFRCWSNCPSFVYTYAKVFHEKGMLISWLDDKYEKPILENESKVRNTYGIISYEKSLYFALQYILLGGRNLLSYILAHSIVFHSPDELRRMIQSHENVMRRYNKAKELTALEKLEAEKKKQEKKSQVKTKKNKQSIASIPSVEKNKTKSVKSVRSVKKIKRS